MFMMQDPDVNFYEVQKKFNDYWQNRTDYKGNGYKMFKRWEYINHNRVLPDGKLQHSNYIVEQINRYQEAQKAIRKPANRSAAGIWSQLVPNTYPVNNTAQPTGLGRVNAMAFHPTDANTLYAGASSGGIWKSVNGGTSWVNISGNLPRLSISAILVHPGNADTLYVGTGDRDGGDGDGIGVYKSTDGGLTWSPYNKGMGAVTVCMMLMHPSNPSILLAATKAGVYKSTDGGKNWSLKISGDVRDIKFKPNDPNIVYITKIVSPSQFWRSADNGNTWTQITSGIPTTGIGARMVIGVSPANSNYVYLVQILSSNSNFAGIIRSTDAGLTFTTRSTTPNIFDYACNGSGTSSQASYDLCIAVDPNHADTLLVGSINNWISKDGGSSWTINSHWVGSTYGTSCGASVHADQHSLDWSPLNGKLYEGNDGGVYVTSNLGNTWTEISSNLSISQAYKLGQSLTNPDYTVAGLQDNGCIATTNGSNCFTTAGGDGGECVIDYQNTNYCYNTYINGVIRRTTGGPAGSYSTIAGSGINGITESGAWITPYLLHRNTPTTMFVGYKNIWRSANVRASSVSSVVWEKISSGETENTEVLEQSPANLNIMYAVRGTTMKRTNNANATAASVAWTTCSLPGGLIPTDVKAHYTDSNIVYATAGYGVYKSTNQGLTWTNISGNLPALFTNCLAIDKNGTEAIYVGNQTSIWFKNASMADWILFSDGLPPVDIRELEIYYDNSTPSNNRIYAATFGRGLWKSDLAEINVINPTSLKAIPVSTSEIDLTWNLNASGNPVIIAVNSVDVWGTPVTGTSYSIGNTLSGGGTIIYVGNATSFAHTALATGTKYYYKIWSYNGSNQFSAGLPAVSATTYSHQWTAGAGTTDWFTSGNWGTNSVPTPSDNVYIPSTAPFFPVINAVGANCANLFVETGASLGMSNTTAYTLQVGGDMTIKGTFNRGIGTIEFNGDNALQTVKGNGTLAFQNIKVNKSLIDNIVEFTTPITLNGSTNPLILTSGTFKLSSASVITPFTSSPSIGTNCGIWNNGGTINSGNFGWTLNAGTLRNSSGSFNVGGVADNSIVYLNNGKLIIEGGTVTLAGRFQPNSGISIGTYSQSGGTFIVNTKGSSSITRGIFELNPNASFAMSGGTLVFVRNSSNASPNQDVMLLANTNSVSGGTLQFGNSLSPQKYRFRLRSTIGLNNLILEGTYPHALEIQTNSLSLSGDLQIGNGDSLITNNLPLQISGNITNNGTLNGGNSMVVLNGTSIQNLSGSALLRVKKLDLNNSNGLSLSGTNDLQADSMLKLSSGLITTGNNKVIINDNAIVYGADVTHYISGFCRKVGNDAFSFPVGKSGKYAPILISAPANVTDHFTASYYTGTPHPTYDTSSKQAPVVQVSPNEYWKLDRTNGTSSVGVTLTWESARSGSVSDPATVLVSRWNGAQWVSEGNATYSGNSASGSVTSNSVNNFSPFSLANATLVPLQVKMFNFTATKTGREALLKWSVQVDLSGSGVFTVEKSNDLKNWKTISSVAYDLQAAIQKEFSAVDINPANGMNFYRIKQTANNGWQTYSAIRPLDFTNSQTSLVLIPNPADRSLFINTSYTEFVIHIFDQNGKLVAEGKNTQMLDISSLSNGKYFCVLSDNFGNKLTEIFLVTHQ